MQKQLPRQARRAQLVARHFRSRKQRQRAGRLGAPLGDDLHGPNQPLQLERARFIIGRQQDGAHGLQLSRFGDGSEAPAREQQPRADPEREGAMLQVALAHGAGVSEEKAIQELKRLESSASRRLKIAVTQAWPEEGSILIDRANHGVEIWTIVGQNTVFPKNVVEEIIPAIERLPSAPRQRMVKSLDMALYVADEEAAVMFPNRNGQVDMNAMFVGKEQSFVEWCSDLFDHVWARAGPFDILKTKIA